MILIHTELQSVFYWCLSSALWP